MEKDLLGYVGRRGGSIEEGLTKEKMREVQRRDQVIKDRRVP